MSKFIEIQQNIPQPQWCPVQKKVSMLFHISRLRNSIIGHRPSWLYTFHLGRRALSLLRVWGAGRSLFSASNSTSKSLSFTPHSLGTCHLFPAEINHWKADGPKSRMVPPSKTWVPAKGLKMGTRLYGT